MKMEDASENMSMRPFIIVNVACLVLVVPIHVATFFDVDVSWLEALYPFFFFGLAAVYLPAVIVMSSMQRAEWDGSGLGLYRILQKYAPRLYLLNLGVFLYMIGNGLYYTYQHPDKAGMVGDERVLLRGKEVIRKLTAEEYPEHVRQYATYSVRLFSSFAMAFLCYGVTTLVALENMRKEKRETEAA